MNTIEADQIICPRSLQEVAEANAPPHILLPRGMLLANERRLLYLLCRDNAAVDSIVDAGAFCGASAYAMAAGLFDSKYDRMGVEPGLFNALY